MTGFLHNGSSTGPRVVTDGRRLRVGFVGAGYIADWHAKAVKLAGGAELAAVCDLAVARARATAAAHGLPADRAFASVDQMLETMRAAGGLDAVHVLTTPESHDAVAERVIAAGVPVLIEKPMCLTAEACQRLVTLAHERRVPLAIGHNF